MVWRPLLKSDGVMAFTEVSWLKDGRPEPLEQFWREVYPSITSIDRNVEILTRSGYRLIDRFVLPESDWWNEYYNPIADKLQGIKEKHKEDPEALQVIGMAEDEIALFQKYSSYYGYVFYIGERQSK